MYWVSDIRFQVRRTDVELITGAGRSVSSFIYSRGGDRVPDLVGTTRWAGHIRIRHILSGSKPDQTLQFTSKNLQLRQCCKVLKWFQSRLNYMYTVCTFLEKVFF
jgi:hypothetical protein